MRQTLQIAAKNWQTTLAGCVAAVIAILDAVVKATDGNPATTPDYALVVATITTAIGLIFARQANVTSKQLGLNDD